MLRLAVAVGAAGALLAVVAWRSAGHRRLMRNSRLDFNSTERREITEKELMFVASYRELIGAAPLGGDALRQHIVHVWLAIKREAHVVSV